jgi:hypothetical protein
MSLVGLKTTTRNHIGCHRCRISDQRLHPKSTRSDLGATDFEDVFNASKISIRTHLQPPISDSSYAAAQSIDFLIKILPSDRRFYSQLNATHAHMLTFLSRITHIFTL